MLEKVVACRISQSLDGRWHWALSINPIRGVGPDGAPRVGMFYSGETATAAMAFADTLRALRGNVKVGRLSRSAEPSLRKAARRV